MLAIHTKTFSKLFTSLLVTWEKRNFHLLCRGNFTFSSCNLYSIGENAQNNTIA